MKKVIELFLFVLLTFFIFNSDVYAEEFMTINDSYYYGYSTVTVKNNVSGYGYDPLKEFKFTISIHRDDYITISDINYDGSVSGVLTRGYGTVRLKNNDYVTLKVPVGYLFTINENNEKYYSTNGEKTTLTIEENKDYIFNYENVTTSPLTTDGVPIAKYNCKYNEDFYGGLQLGKSMEVSIINYTGNVTWSFEAGSNGGENTFSVQTVNNKAIIKALKSGKGYLIATLDDGTTFSQLIFCYEKVFYNRADSVNYVYNSIFDLKDYFSMIYVSDEADTNSIWNEVISKNNEITTFIYYYHNSLVTISKTYNNKYIYYVYSKKKGASAPTEEEIANYRNEISNLVKNLTKGINSDLQKLTRIYSWITKNITYEMNSYGNSGYGTYTHRKGYCQGYARLFIDMCKALSIEADFVSGIIKHTYGDASHAWATAKVDGKWYFFDPTADRLGGGSDGLYYFCVTKSKMEKIHKRFLYPEYETNEFISKHPLGELTPAFVGESGDYVLYYYEPGGFPGSKTTVIIDNVLYTTNWDGSVLSQTKLGLQTIGGKLYYYDTNGKTVTGWKKINNIWYYFGSDGSASKGWLKYNNKWYYLDSSYHMVTGLKTINYKNKDTIFYFNTNGEMQIGWQKVDGYWYYFDKETGGALTGWQMLSDSHGKFWFYFNSNGQMQTGFKTIKYNGKDCKFYFNSDGEMQVGWKKINNIWYYFNKDTGVMLTGWQKLSDSNGTFWFYFNSNGQMLTGLQTIKYNGKDCKFYFNSDGEMQVGWQTINGKKYYFDSNGVMK